MSYLILHIILYLYLYCIVLYLYFLYMRLKSQTRVSLLFVTTSARISSWAWYHSDIKAYDEDDDGDEDYKNVDNFCL